MWEPGPLTTIWASAASYRDSLPSEASSDASVNLVSRVKRFDDLQRHGIYTRFS
jgi:hypothetical protein